MRNERDENRNKIGQDVYWHLPYMVQTNGDNLVGDGKVGGAGEEGGSVGQGGAALAVAHGKLNLVQTRLEGLILRGLSLKVELDSVLAGGKAGVDLAVAERLRLGGDDADLELAGAGLVEHGEENIDLEGGALGSGGGGDAHLVELCLAAIVDGASVENLETQSYTAPN